VPVGVALAVADGVGVNVGVGDGVLQRLILVVQAAPKEGQQYFADPHIAVDPTLETEEQLISRGESPEDAE
jgi:hypothetical protein